MRHAALNETGHLISELAAGFWKCLPLLPRACSFLSPTKHFHFAIQSTSQDPFDMKVQLPSSFSRQSEHRPNLYEAGPVRDDSRFVACGLKLSVH